MRRASGWLLRLGLLLVGLALGLGGAELAIRAAGTDPLVMNTGLLGNQTARPDCMRPAPWVGYELVPGACHANSLGFHDDEPVEPRPPGGKLVVALGDSITEQRAWVDVLERMLEQRLEVPVEVRNMGVTGYSVLNELALLERRALDFEPDLVVLQVCLNDYGVTPVLVHHDGELRWLRAATGGLGGLELWLFEHSALARNLVLRGVSTRMGGMGNEEHMAQVDAALGRMQQLCHERGIPFELVIFPTIAPREQWSPTEEATYLRLVEQAAVHGISTTDLTPRLLGGEIDTLRRHRVDEIWGDLDAHLAAWGAGPEAATLLRSMDRRWLGLGKRLRPEQRQDTTHPNFLGHFLAAEALAGKLASEL